MTESAHRFVAIAEDITNARAASALVDRTISERCEVDWLRELWDDQPSARAWTPIDGDGGHSFDRGRYSKLTQLPKLVPQVRALRVAGGGKAVEVAKAIAATEWTDTCERADAVVIAYDADDEDDEARIRDEFERRRAQFEQAHTSCKLLLALARPEAEAWSLAAIAQEDVDHARLADFVREFGFDPRWSPERLRSTASNSPRDTKSVLARLIAHQRVDDVSRCVDSVALDEWLRRGAKCGVDALYRAVIEQLIPTLTKR